MSRSLNKVTLIGNLGADPEVRSTANGSRVATLSIATSRQWKNQRARSRRRPSGIAWSCGTTRAPPSPTSPSVLQEGRQGVRRGQHRVRSWQDREGQTRYTTEINGRELILLSGKGDGSESFTPRRSAPGRRRRAPQGKESFEEFPEALDAEDDDLPF